MASTKNIQSIHGWSARQVQKLQRKTAQALGLAVEFRDTLEDGSRGPLIVVIPGGRFLMGSPTDEPGRYKDERQHEVEVAPFAIGKYTVTFEEYDRFAEATLRSKPSDLKWGQRRGRRPVKNVGWYDAITYTEWLSQQTSQTYRLPTEAEWEYACRAGTTTAYHFGTDINTSLANYDDGRSFFRPKADVVEVGRYPANAWGLHDMHGNVEEWTCSAYSKHSNILEWIFSAHSEPYDGSEQRCADPRTAGWCVLRGGAWTSGLEQVRAAARHWSASHMTTLSSGFRLARTFP